MTNFLSASIPTMVGYALIGWLLGIAVNALADYLPMRRHAHIAAISPFSTIKPIPPHLWPHAPVWAWSGLISAITRHPISDPPRYTRRVIVELLLIVAIPYITHSVLAWDLMLFHLLLAPLLVLIAVIDIEHRFIFDETLLFGVIITLWRVAAFNFWEDALRGMVIFGGAFVALWLFGYVFGALIRLLTGRRIGRTILGFGDVKLAIMIGLMVSSIGVLPAFIVTTFTGAIGAVIFILSRRFGKRRRYRAFNAIPYGPFLILGGATVIYARDLAGMIVYWITQL